VLKTSPPQVQESEIQAVAELHGQYRRMTESLAETIVGMQSVIEQLFIALLCRGHCILEGAPGLAKTLLVSQVASMLGLTFRRIQFTPDLMPADITGTDILEEDHTTGRRVFRFVKGPLFANIVLADEINRTPPKTQSALLEAMQERQLTVGGETYKLPEPFFVLATQNPIEQEGTYPLPEAQLDRFMFKIKVDYPSEEQELDIVKRATTDYAVTTSEILSGETVERLQAIVRRVPVADHVYMAAIRLVRLSRPDRDHGSNGDGAATERGKARLALASRTGEFVRDMVNWGGGPRASIYLLLAAKARAILHGRYHVTTEDLVAMAPPVLRHRIIPTFNAEASGLNGDVIVARLVEATLDGEAAGRMTGR
jgi:MoxR-like ATPase